MFVSYQVVAGSSPTLLRQNDPIQTLVVTHFIISNSNTGNENVSVFLVPPNGTPSITNAVIYLNKVTGNSYIEGTGGFVVPPSYSIWVSSSSGNVTVATISGVLSASPQSLAPA